MHIEAEKLSLSWDAYHADHSRVTRTALKCFMESRSDYHAIYVAGTRKPKVAKPKSEFIRNRGIALHAVLIEGKRHEDFLKVYPESCLKSNGDLKPGKDGPDQFRADNPGALCLKAGEKSGLLNMLLAIQRNPIIARDVSDPDALREKEYHATICGVECKARLDLDRPHEDEAIDYKFMESIDPGAIERSTRRFAYWLQDAHYKACAMRGKLIFRCIEVFEPFRVHDYWLDLPTRGMAFDKHEWLLGELKACRDSGDWSDVWPNEIALPPWAFQMKEEDQMVEFVE